MTTTRRHPNDRDLYTPFGDDFEALLERMYRELGSWRMVAWRSGLRLKVLRRIRQGQYKAITMTTVDRLVTGTGVGSLDEFLWFTANDMVRLGIWEPNLYVEGNERVQGDARWERVQKSRVSDALPELHKNQERGKISKKQVR